MRPKYCEPEDLDGRQIIYFILFVLEPNINKQDSFCRAMQRPSSQVNLKLSKLFSPRLKVPTTIEIF